jgi:hypothetical protein
LALALPRHTIEGFAPDNTNFIQQLGFPAKQNQASSQGCGSELCCIMGGCGWGA